MGKKEIVKQFLKSYFEDDELPIQAFTSRNWVGDVMCTIYEKNGITIDYCYYYDYIEIFGIGERIFNQLKKEKEVIK